MRIGVFDSGIGGITVLSEIRKRLGSVDYVYLGDTAHLPYGTKSPAQVERLSVDCARILKGKKVDALVVACNTASSLAIDAIRREMSPLPVFGMVEPGVAAVLSVLASQKPFPLRGQDPSFLVGEDRSFPRLNEGEPASLAITAPFPILVLATRATVRSGAYGKGLRKLLLQGAEAAVIEQACPLLVPMIEEGWIDHPILHDTLAEYVGPHVLGGVGLVAEGSLASKNGARVPGVALLGCTHYPWIQAAIQKSLPGWIIVDSAHAVAAALERSDLLLNYKNHEGISKIEWIFTDPDAVPAFALKMIQSMNSGEI